MATFKFANDGNGGTIVFDPPLPNGQRGNLPTENLANDPVVSGPTSVASSVAATAHDSFVFGPNFGQETITSFPETDAIQISKKISATFDGLLAATHDDSRGNAVVAYAAHDTIIQNVATAHLQALHGDFHLV